MAGMMSLDTNQLTSSCTNDNGGAGRKLLEKQLPEPTGALQQQQQQQQLIMLGSHRKMRMVDSNATGCDPAKVVMKLTMYLEPTTDISKFKARLAGVINNLLVCMSVCGRDAYVH